jgi:hypothetical protein
MGDPIDGLGLFEVDVTYRIYVLAEDEIDAEMNAPDYLRDEMADPEVHAVAVRDAGRLSADARGSLPHGEFDNDPPTVEECLAIIAARNTGESAEAADR